MTYTRRGDAVTIEMTTIEYADLLCALGFALGAAMEKNTGMTRALLRFVNQLNRTNPEYTPYEVPEG